ncbi:M23 family metallopeptidase [Algoriphagus sediminis]|uniref:M23 family metallopeptidase n=1 Tax=Algoriphagus sediminis TaxID=3057113 RepID=A0ABT7YAC5_9BACT|nr:M23 family metallopeptidase [Algoriphagus sediminis]MDN3203482.1 M23 family metallopeptidase [Algoriphagus sediminis]
MKLNRLLFFSLFLAFSTSLLAQEVVQDYYISPVRPGDRNYLSGNFAELRPNHFHAGLDFKFGGQSGEPIFAAADGWVQRIKISTYGYGNVIYLKHPNGQITVYGHLRNFNDKLTKYILSKMYEAEQNSLEVYPEPGELPVKQGEQIANGGNTGSSGGPHLHFEIRDSLDRAMDPLLFGFPEIIDQTAPTPQSIAFVPLDINSRINGRFERLEITPQSTGRDYKLPSTIQITGKVGIEVRSFDRLDGASNRNGFPNFQIIEEDSLLLNLTVDKVDYNLTRQFLLHTHRNRFTKLYKQKSLKYDFISPKHDSAGHISLENGESKDYELKLIDALGNQRTVSFTMEGRALETQVNSKTASSRAQIDYHKNIMEITAPISSEGGLAKFFVGENTFEMLPAYQDSRSRTYLWDMNFGIPDMVDICSEVLEPEVLGRIPYETELLFASPEAQVTFEEESLLEDLFLRMSSSGSGNAKRLHLHTSEEFLWNPIKVDWNISPGSFQRDKTHVYRVSGNGSKSFAGGQWKEGSIEFETRNFGNFALAQDLEKPSIKPIRINSSQIRFVIRDNLSGINNFEARVNGEWVLMRYEHKQAVIWSETLDKQPLKGEVVLKVTDEAGNVAEWTGTIN